MTREGRGTVVLSDRFEAAHMTGPRISAPSNYAARDPIPKPSMKPYANGNRKVIAFRQIMGIFAQYDKTLIV
jgi:hypothetical protein